LTARLLDNSGDAEIICEGRAIREGMLIFDKEIKLTYRRGKLIEPPPAPFVIKDQADGVNIFPAYFELSIYSATDKPMFRSKHPFGTYTVYTKGGKKGFLSDNSYKYGSPPVIEQIEKAGKYIDAYPVIHLDKYRDLGESILFINPYKKPILAQIKTFDDRKVPRIRIPAESVRNFDMSLILKAEECDWSGHIQVTATNRVVTFSIKHSLEDPHIISDHEHLDPYRTENTHEKASLFIRKWVEKKVFSSSLNVFRNGKYK
jgi:hypothetical protein